MHLELRLYRAVHTLLQQFGERLSTGRISILVSEAAQTRLLTNLLAKHKLCGGDEGDIYYNDGYYLEEGGRLAECQYMEIIQELERDVELAVKHLIAQRDALTPGGSSSGQSKEMSDATGKTTEAVKWCVAKYRENKKKGKRNVKRGIARESVEIFFASLTGNKRKKKIDAIRNSYLAKLGLRKASRKRRTKGGRPPLHREIARVRGL